MPQRREWRSFQPSGCCFVSLLLVILLLADGVSAGNKARGIDPQDLDYFKDDIIWCKDGLKSFPRERLNDNFCDCADGTDEPGTSACPDGKYYCQNVGSAPTLVYSSRVNDGICDCCDGSDEYKTRVDCTNTCGGTSKEVSESMEEDFGQSTTFDTVDVSEVVPVKQQRKFGEDLVTKLKEMKSIMLVMQWLPLFSLLSLFVWMWARIPRRLPFRQKKSSRPSLV